jgi:Xaa-Pro dipeptidase
LSSEFDLSTLAAFHGQHRGNPQFGDVLSYHDLPAPRTGTEAEAETARVLSTAADRPATDTMPPVVDPTLDHEDAALRDRRADVEEKHRRVREYLDAHDFDAMALGRVDSIAWFTSGGELGREFAGEVASALIYITRSCRAVVTDNVQSARIFEEELAGLGFQLKERPWYEDSSRVLEELGHKKKLVTDLAGATPWSRESHDSSSALVGLRRPLTRLERQRLRELGRTLTLAVEATCRNFHPGETEADVAGHLAHRLLREGVAPVGLQIAGDERLERHRRPGFKGIPIRQKAMISVVGRRFGLCAAVGRCVTFGHADESFKTSHALASMISASNIFFSRPGESVGAILGRTRRLFEKNDHPHEWTLDYAGQFIGYSPNEGLLLPESTRQLEPGTALFWSPSVLNARSEDTVVVDARGFEVVTQAQKWPMIEVTVKGYAMPRPGILER